MAAEERIRLADIPNNGAVRCVVGGREIAVFRKGAEVYAIDAQCPHRRGPLDEGTLEDEWLTTCPWHGWQFDIRTGKSPAHPGQVLCYSAVVDGEDVVVRVG